MKHLSFLLCLVSFQCIAQEDSVYIPPPVNPQSMVYLNDLRLACVAKDTAQLHRLIGDHAFGMPCYGGAMSQNYSFDWDIFRERFDLIEQPEESEFWELFLRLSNDGFYFDGSYTIPAVHYWGILSFDSPADIFEDPAKYAFLNPTVLLHTGSSPLAGETTSFTPEKITINYPYTFVAYDEDWLECFANGQRLGFVSVDDVYDGYLYFRFGEDENGFHLDFYETCP